MRPKSYTLHSTVVFMLSTSHSSAIVTKIEQTTHDNGSGHLSVETLLGPCTEFSFSLNSFVDVFLCGRNAHSKPGIGTEFETIDIAMFGY